MRFELTTTGTPCPFASFCNCLKLSENRRAHCQMNSSKYPRKTLLVSKVGLEFASLFGTQFPQPIPVIPVAKPATTQSPRRDSNLTIVRIFGRNGHTRRHCRIFAAQAKKLARHAGVRTTRVASKAAWPVCFTASKRCSSLRLWRPNDAIERPR